MESRKRKKCHPKRLSVEERSELAWSLTDLSLRASLEENSDLQDSRGNSLIDFTGAKPSSSASKTKPKQKRTKHSNGNKESSNLFIKTSFPSSWYCVLGSFTLVLTGDADTANHEHKSCRITIDLDTLLNKDMQSNGDSIFLPHNLRDLSMEGRPVLPNYLVDALVYLQNKNMLFLSTNTSIFDASWDVMICLYESALTSLKFASQDTTIRKTDKMIKLVMEYFYKSTLTGPDTGTDDERMESGFDDLYKAVMEKKMNNQCKIEFCVDTNNCKCFQHPDLKPTLRGYQRGAVRWMIEKEKFVKSQQNSKESDLHVLWRRYITIDKKILFYNPHNGRLTTRCYLQPVSPLGGILADEMGLGKTVEVLACILNNPKSCEKQLTTNEQHSAMEDSSAIACQSSKSLSIVEGAQTVSCNSTEITKLTLSRSCQATKPIIYNALESFKPIETLSVDDKQETINHARMNMSEESQGTPSSTTCIHGDKTKSDKTTTPLCCDMVETTKPTCTQTSLIEKEEEAQCLPLISIGVTTKPVSHNALQTSQVQPSVIALDQAIQPVTCNSSEVIQTAQCLSLIGEQTIKPESLNTPQTSQVQPSVIALDQAIQPITCNSSEVSLTGAQAVTLNSSQVIQNTQSLSVAGPQPETCNSSEIIQSPQCLSMVGAQPVVSNISEVTQTSQTIPVADTQPAVKCECICGAVESNEDVVKCSNCSIFLHTKCFNGCETGFLCPKCSVNRPPIPSRATLIISPETIVQQWVQEIMRHITPGALKLMVYEGVNKQGFISPEILSDHDIILTTYTTLRTEFHHLRKEEGRNMRYQKRYMAVPSPLTAINFWRICLDEAQMVETTTAKAAEMALQLHCIHRWCVTGTPIQKGLEDIYGLLLFLGAYPYCQKVWWKKLLCDPYMTGHKEPLQNVLSDLLWRTAKNDVLDEIHLPCQTEHLVRLKFTAVEEHFYRRQHEECSSWALRMLRQFGQADVKLNSLDRNTVHKMLIPLLRLRQACCHPQAVRGGFLSMHKSTLTMEQLLENLIAKAKIECEEAHRQLLFAINGLAGVHVIKEEFAGAVDLYRESMRSWMEHEEFFRTDNLQKLHTLHNLHEVLSYGYPGCSHTLRDDKLKDEIDAHIKEYMLKPNAQVQTALNNLEDAKKHTQELNAKADKTSSWWVVAIDCTQRRGLDKELIDRLHDQLSFMENSTILDSFTDWRGLQYVLTAKLEKVKWTRECLVKALDEICVEPSPSLVQSTAMCCLRSQPDDDKQSNKCSFCEVDSVFSEYESRLFGHQGMKGNTGQTNDAAAVDSNQYGNTGGLRAETDTEKALKILFTFIKHYGLAYELHKDAVDHLAFIEALRKEFKVLRAAWFALRERVSSMDELDMCTTRLRLAHPCEQVSEYDTNVIQPCQVSQQKLKFTSDRIVAQTELRKRLGQFVYLTNLSKKSNKGENPETCPVCTKELGKEWSVFSCGHCYCCQCVWVLVRHVNSRFGQVKCPVCRTPTMTAEISYVSSGNEQNSANKGISVKGSHSTKVEAIVRTLLSIAAEDKTAKCLVFSTWQDVLELIGRALAENDVPFKHITCTRRLQCNLDEFKNDTTVNVVLLPLQTGSNGLNIIEATHVLLVEPALNPAHELQAIGRIHRIGQTRPTHVHRFVIEHTVESRMYSLLHSKSSGVARTGHKDTENTSLTIADLATLFDQDDQTSTLEVV